MSSNTPSSPALAMHAAVVRAQLVISVRLSVKRPSALFVELSFVRSFEINHLYSSLTGQQSVGPQSVQLSTRTPLRCAAQYISASGSAPAPGLANGASAVILLQS